MPGSVDITNPRFGRLIVLGRAERPAARAGRGAWWRVRCDCGEEKDVAANAVRRGLTQSCGCLQRERQRTNALKHGHMLNGRASRTYSSWRAMMERCLNPTSANYRR
jgi:hypothetical protein